jgi:hypothetical protein
MKFRTYGCGSKFEIEKFKIPKNNSYFVKPYGGLWASPVNSEFGWIDWCKAENFREDKLNEYFEFEITNWNNIIIIDNEKDMLNKLIWINTDSINFEILYNNNIHGIYLTENGQYETRLTYPYNLYGWDCECMLILNPISIF